MERVQLIRVRNTALAGIRLTENLDKTRCNGEKHVKLSEMEDCFRAAARHAEELLDSQDGR